MTSSPFTSESAAPAPDKPAAPRSTLVSRNVTISGHRTSVRLEPEMWSGLAEICRREGGSLHEVCTSVSQRKGENTSLTAAIRVFVMAYYRAASTEEGHAKAAHGYGAAMLNSNIPVGSPRPAMSAVQSPMSSSGQMSGYARMPMNGNGRGYR